MADTTINENGQANSPKKTYWLPLLFFLIFLSALLFCVWLLWRQFEESHAGLNDEEARLETLLAQKRELEALLKLSPCEAGEKAGLLELPVSPRSAVDDKKAVPQNNSGKKANKAAEDVADLNPDRIEAACVFLVSLAGGNKLSTGSGFFIAPGYIATNRHVVGSGGGKILVTSKALGQPVKGRVVAQGRSKDEDFAIVAVDIPAGASVTPLHLSTDVKKTQKVGAWGFPDIIGKNDPAYASLLKGEDINAVPELSYSEGVVSAVLDRNPRIIVHTAPISPGNSGGPLLDDKGDVVGINTMITLDEDSYRQASLALSAEALASFIRDNGISLP